MRSVISRVARAQLQHNVSYNIAKSHFHASGSLLGGVVGSPSPSRPPIRQPADHSQERELRKLDFDEYLANINTTLTPEQKEYVDKIKHQYKGAAARPSPYRDVPKPHELGNLGNMRPHLADNAEALVDWALSHVPKRDGPRRSRQKKRGEQKRALTVRLAQRRIEEQREATKRKLEKRRRVHLEIKKIKADAKVINAAREEKLRAAGLLRA
eukprot:gene9067-6517_t